MRSFMAASFLFALCGCGPTVCDYQEEWADRCKVPWAEADQEACRDDLRACRADDRQKLEAFWFCMEKQGSLECDVATDTAAPTTVGTTTGTGLPIDGYLRMVHLVIDLASAGLATRRDHGDHAWRFEAADNDGRAHLSAHPHFVCTDCGDVVCLPEAEITLPRGATAPGALKRQKVEVHIRGQCDDCS